MPNFRTIKIYSLNYAAGIRRSYHESSDCFKHPKKSLLKSSYPKKYLLFFKPQKIFRSLKSGVRTTLGKRAYIVLSYSSYLHPALSCGCPFITVAPCCRPGPEMTSQSIFDPRRAKYNDIKKSGKGGCRRPINVILTCFSISPHKKMTSSSQIPAEPKFFRLSFRKVASLIAMIMFSSSVFLFNSAVQIYEIHIFIISFSSFPGKLPTINV